MNPKERDIARKLRADSRRLARKLGKATLIKRLGGSAGIAAEARRKLDAAENALARQAGALEAVHPLLRTGIAVDRHDAALSTRLLRQAEADNSPALFEIASDIMYRSEWNHLPEQERLALFDLHERVYHLIVYDADTRARTIRQHSRRRVKKRNNRRKLPRQFTRIYPRGRTARPTPIGVPTMVDPPVRSVRQETKACTCWLCLHKDLFDANGHLIRKEHR